MGKDRKLDDWGDIARRVATSYEETKTLPASAVLPPSPWELAKLAAILDPELSRRDPIAALKEAASFYAGTLLYWHELMSSGDAATLLEFHMSDDLGAALGAGWKAEHELLEERTWKRFDPTDSPDEVKDFFGVKQARSVRETILSYFETMMRTPPGTREGKRAQAEREWNEYKRTDVKGKPFYLLPPELLDRIKAWRREQKRAGGRRALQTRKRVT